MARKSRYLTYTDRLIIERLHRHGLKNNVIASILEVHESTISRELKRGYVETRDYLWRPIDDYSASVGQDYAEWQASAKGRPMAIGKQFDLVEHIETEILAGKSPDVIIHELERKGRKIFSTVTLYRYIDSGFIFPNISNKNLLEKSHRRPRKDHGHRRASRPPCGLSIEHRPQYIDTREDFGHWEMDCVIGKSEGKNQTLLVFTERKTREELIFKLRSRTSRSVVRVLDGLQKVYDFPNVFKSITVDNGSEFSDAQGMQFTKSGKRRTTVYYCHPYASSERGSNERMNRMIRRFFPKGQSLAHVTSVDCKRVENWLNNYPRKILGYRTPNELFQAELRKFTKYS